MKPALRKAMMVRVLLGARWRSGDAAVCKTAYTGSIPVRASSFLFNNRFMRKRSWNFDQLQKAVVDSYSFRQVLFRLGLRAAGGNYSQIKKYIQEASLDVSHFRGKGWSAGLKGIGKPRLTLEDILVKGSFFQSYKLKKRLFTAGLKPLHCEECGWAKRSSEGYLPLELDHINGDRYDNRLENLRVLCPNCHSLKPTHRGRKLRNQARVVKWQTLDT